MNSHFHTQFTVSGLFFDVTAAQVRIYWFSDSILKRVIIFLLASVVGNGRSLNAQCPEAVMNCPLCSSWKHHGYLFGRVRERTLPQNIIFLFVPKLSQLAPPF